MLKVHIWTRVLMISWTPLAWQGKKEMKLCPLQPDCCLLAIKLRSENYRFTRWGIYITLRMEHISPTNSKAILLKLPKLALINWKQRLSKRSTFLDFSENMWKTILKSSYANCLSMRWHIEVLADNRLWKFASMMRMDIWRLKAPVDFLKVLP